AGDRGSRDARIVGAEEDPASLVTPLVVADRAAGDRHFPGEDAAPLVGRAHVSGDRAVGHRQGPREDAAPLIGGLVLTDRAVGHSHGAGEDAAALIRALVLADRA